MVLRKNVSMTVATFFQWNNPTFISFFVDHYKPLTRYFSSFILYNNQLKQIYGSTSTRIQTCLSPVMVVLVCTQTHSKIKIYVNFCF